MRRYRKSPIRGQTSVSAWTATRFVQQDNSNFSSTFRIPYLPIDAPSAPSPECMNLPLYEHQQRSLYRMMQIENGCLGECYNFGKIDYFPRGGCLCDAVGMGKTATMLALICSEPKECGVGANVIVCPPHLIVQWKNEAAKFIKDGDVEIIAGLDSYQRANQAEFSNRTIVLLSADDVVNSNVRLHPYSYPGTMGHEVVGRDIPSHCDFTRDTLHERCSKVARYVNKGYRAGVWVSTIHMPINPWRRVIFEEVQDLIDNQAQRDCFIQLTYSVKNVWLITATPFPRKDVSVNANNELLGFRRLKLHCKDDIALIKDHPLEIIKRRLYLRNPEQVRVAAIADKVQVTNVVIYCEPTDLELVFYNSEARYANHEMTALLKENAAPSFVNGVSVAETVMLQDGEKDSREARAARRRDRDTGEFILDTATASADHLTANTSSISGTLSPVQVDPANVWRKDYLVVRQTLSNPGMSNRLLEMQEELGISRDALLRGKLPNTLARAARRSSHILKKARAEIAENRNVLTATENAIAIVRAIMGTGSMVTGSASVDECFEDLHRSGLYPLLRTGVCQFRCIGSHLRPTNAKKRFLMQDHVKPIDCVIEIRDEIQGYLNRHCNTRDEQDHFVTTMTTNLASARHNLQVSVEGERLLLQDDMEIAKVNPRLFNESPLDSDFVRLAKIRGAKISCLIQHLKENEEKNRAAWQRVLDLSLADRAAVSAVGGTVSTGATAPPLACDRIKSVIFTMWDDMIDVVRQALSENGISASVFGKRETDQQKRSTELDRFASPDVDVLLLSSRTSASGINLQIATEVIFLDAPGTDSSTEGAALQQQAVGRIVRMGQTKPVKIIRIISRRTVDETLFAQVQEASQAAATKLTQQDLAATVTANIDGELPRPTSLYVSSSSLSSSSESSISSSSSSFSSSFSALNRVVAAESSVSGGGSRTSIACAKEDMRVAYVAEGYSRPLLQRHIHHRHTPHSGARDSLDTDDVYVCAVKTLDQILTEQAKQAELSGQMICIDEDEDVATVPKRRQ